jgi:uncharacterized transporter YbjL
MKNLAKYLLLTVLIFVTVVAQAQSPEMADVMRSEGKIYVVVCIILIVLTGLIAYLFLQDRKISRLQKMIDEKSQTK